jgi:hypothetical protein
MHPHLTFAAWTDRPGHNGSFVPRSTMMRFYNAGLMHSPPNKAGVFGLQLKSGSIGFSAD